ncbi:MAG: ABC transporter ATP-binding protein [Betaproteobacteria bacterium]|nr:MAG: ABC transporter ATP-binding protein [Betaproteobacteria bacterium]
MAISLVKTSTAAAESKPPLLEVRNIEVVYHDVVFAVKGVSLTVAAGQVVTLFGPNGAGKTSLVRAISRLLQSVEGEIRSGSVRFDGNALDALAPHQIARRGLYQIPEGGNVIKELTVRENLLLSQFCRDGSGSLNDDYARVVDRFPLLKTREAQLGGYLSGGEQQMLSMAKALLANPRLLVLDEPSLGLSPMLMQENFDALRELNRDFGIAILAIEQNARVALDIASYGYVMESGRVVYDGPAEQLRENREIQEFYLGLEGGLKKSFRDVKHYKRRKRWLS